MKAWRSGLFQLCVLLGVWQGAQAQGGAMPAESELAHRLQTAAARCESQRLQSSASGPCLVLLVRHAEKAEEPAGDPPLSAAGQARAEVLADLLKPLRLDGVIVSRWQRTQQTAAPVARLLGLTPQVVEGAPGSGLAGHVEALRLALQRHTGIVLVVGHSNTLPALAERLGLPAHPVLCEQRFSLLWMLELGTATGTRATELRYGAADPPGCP